MAAVIGAGILLETGNQRQPPSRCDRIKRKQEKGRKERNQSSLPFSFFLFFLDVIAV
jgi:hypothetical protein